MQLRIEQLISIHAPRMGSDGKPVVVERLEELFQSTLPGWGATRQRAGTIEGIADFNPRSPDGERRRTRRFCRAMIDFNPRSPDGERLQPRPLNPLDTEFQSTLPGWGATQLSRRGPRARGIPIHAPRMGSDRENGHLRPRYGQNHPFSTLIVSQIVVDVLGTVRKSQKTPAH